jgi:hypothetical protein
MGQVVDNWLRECADDDRFSYVRVATIRKALATPRVVDALLEQLRMPIKRGADLESKTQALVEHLTHLVELSGSEWYGQQGTDLLVQQVHESRLLSQRYVHRDFFSGVRLEADLLAPVASWLHAGGMEVHVEVPMGKNRVDLLGYRPSTWMGLSATKVIAVELKNDLGQLGRALDQLATFADYSTQAYLACTPLLAAKYVWRHSRGRGVKGWDDDVLNRQLSRIGVGLLLVEGPDVFEWIEDSASPVAANRLDEVLSQLERGSRVVFT